jgi:hypothetical protein
MLSAPVTDAAKSGQPPSRRSVADRQQRPSARASSARPSTVPEVAAGRAGLAALQRCANGECDGATGQQYAGLTVQARPSPRSRVPTASVAKRFRPSQVPVSPGRGATPVLQRECAECEAGRPCTGQGEEKLQAARRPSAVPVTKAAAAEVRAVVDGGSGRVLDERTRGEMEARLGGDFSSVRVHTDEAAARSAAGVQARAYTVGNAVVFGTGAFAPDSPEGRRTLAHELVHVQQQSRGPVAGTDTGGGIAVSDPGDRFEREAESISAKALGTSFPAARPAANGARQTIGSPGPPGSGRMLGPGLPESQDVQRQTDPEASDGASQAASGEPSPAVAEAAPTAGPVLSPAVQADLEAASSAIAEFNEGFAAYATAAGPNRDLVASAGPPASPPVVQTAPDAIVQRAGEGGSKVKIEGGVVGSVQACYDLCTGDVSLVGWIWAGAGIDTSLGWYGTYAFYEREFWRGNPGLGHLNCGTCDPACAPKGDDKGEWGAGFAAFPVVIKAGDWARIKLLGLEVGLLVTPHSFCDADVEVIALIDLIKYLGPAGAAVTAATEGLNKLLARIGGAHVECGLGIDISGSVHLCKSIAGGVTADKALVCGGGYIGCGIGLSHDKAALPK